MKAANESDLKISPIEIFFFDLVPFLASL